jgi:imidazolonepropionase-like amidohydrolase
MISIRHTFVAGLLLTACASAYGGDGDSFVLRAGTIYPVSAAHAGPIHDGAIVVRDGRIVAVGADLKLPDDLPQLHWPDAVVCPGFVSAASYVTQRHSGPQSVGAYRAIDAYDAYADNKRQLSWGTTSAHLSPGGHRLVSGVGSVVKLGGDAAGRVLLGQSDICVNLGQFDPPPLIERPFYASSDVAIKPATPQRPRSRMGQFLELDERITRGDSGEFDYHTREFSRGWKQGLPLRIQARRAVDIEGAMRFAARHGRALVLVGATEADLLVDQIIAADVPIVLRLEETYDRPTYSLGDSPDALQSYLDLAARLGKTPKLALAGRDGEHADLRMIALMAMRGGLPMDAALEAITRVPAEILGVGDRVGSIEPGKDADLLVLSGAPLDVTTHVLRTFVGGRTVFEAPQSDALVIRAGTVWVGNGEVLRDSSVLVENGKIRAVGQRVPHPPYARLIDAGRDAFVSPGFIDAHGHLGLEGDQSAPGAHVGLHRTIGSAGIEFLRVARAGVTTVMLSAYRSAGDGSRISAMKTYGDSREALTARAVAGLSYGVAGTDPLLLTEGLKKSLKKGKKYVEQWDKYFKELEQWKKDQADGKATEAKPEEVTETTEKKTDPITGTWEYTISGGPIPEPVTSTMLLKLNGTEIEGRMIDPTGGGEESILTGTLDGQTVRMEIDQETPFGNPVIACQLDREDHMIGTVEIGSMLELDFEATRTDKTAVEFKVKRKKKHGEDGRPTPPKVDEGLEPYRDLLAAKIPAVVEARTAAEIVAVLSLLVDEYKVPVVLLGAEDAAEVADAIGERKDKVGVVAPPQVVRSRDRKLYNQAADLSARGIGVALQSDSEDAARNLPLMALYAVQQGMGGDAVLRALTIDAAKMYHIDDRLGSLEPGKDADILIHSGHPFDAGSRLQRVIVGGSEVPIDDR